MLDVVVVGGGHNGLSLSGFLAKAGLNVLVGLPWSQHVTFLDSAGLGLVACKYVTLCRHQGQLKLCNLRARSHEVLKVTKLLSVFESFESEAAAIASFSVAGADSSTAP